MALATVAFIRGAAWDLHPYALSQYAYTYEEGFLIRALTGHITFALCGEDWQAAGQFASFFGWVGAGLFFFSFFYAIRKIEWFRNPRTTLVLVLVTSGPLFVSIGATRGYFDGLIFGMGLLSWTLFDRGRYLFPLAILALAVFIHELVAVYFLPLFAFSILLKIKDENAKTTLRRIGVVLAVVALVFTVVFQGKATETQITYLAEKMARSKPEFSDGWRRYEKMGMAAAKQSVLKEIKLRRIKNLFKRKANRPYLITSFFILLIIITGLYNKPLMAISALLVTLSPLLILLVAWDVDRFLSLLTMVGAFTAGYAAQFIRPRTAYVLSLPILLVSLCQLTIKYSTITQYAKSNTVLDHLLALIGIG